MMWITKYEVERENRMVLVRILFFILFTVLTFTLIASASAQPPIPTPPLPPIFTDLNITPAEVERGDNVTVSFDIMNTDSQSITYGVTMWIENAAFPPPFWPPYDVTLRIWVDLEAYESKTVSHTLTLDTIGEYHVWVEGLTGIFTVGTWPPEPPPRPAEFVVSDLTITPEEAELWGDIEDWTFTITVNVTNVGEQEGTHTLYLKVDGMEADWRTVNLRGGETTMIVYDVTRGAGPAYVGEYVHLYTVEVDGLKGNFTVKGPKPAEFTVTGLVISLEEIEEGEGVAIHVNVMNIGEEEGSYTLEIEIDGVVTETVKVTLDGGESTTVTFMGGGAIGDHTVEIGELSGSFTVNPKPTFWDKIPGPPYESIILGLVTGVLVLLLLSRRK